MIIIQCLQISIQQYRNLYSVKTIEKGEKIPEATRQAGQYLSITYYGMVCVERTLLVNGGEMTALDKARKPHSDIHSIASPLLLPE